MTRWQLVCRLLKVLFTVFIAKDYHAAFKLVFPDAVEANKNNLPPLVYCPQLRKMVRR